MLAQRPLGNGGHVGPVLQWIGEGLEACASRNSSRCRSKRAAAPARRGERNISLTEATSIGYLEASERHKWETVMRWEDRIAIDPKVLAGKPVVKGTRLAVEFIVDLLAQGWNEAQILDNYPGITRDDIRACLQYASEVLRSERVFPVSTRS